MSYKQMSFSVYY